MNAQLERTRQNVADQITTHKNIHEGIVRKYEQEIARVNGAMDVLFEVLNDIDKLLNKDASTAEGK